MLDPTWPVLPYCPPLTQPPPVPLYDPTGGFSLTEDLNDNKRLKYAILSYTWNKDNNEEVTFEDLVKGTGKGKIGYDKDIILRKTSHSRWYLVYLGGCLLHQ
jgi:hypothetical protein